MSLRSISKLVLQEALFSISESRIVSSDDSESSWLDNRNVTLYTHRMIKTFRHKGIEAYFETGSKAGIQPHHATKLRKQLLRLDYAKGPIDMNVPGWNLHRLSTGEWSVWVNGSWRMTFNFDGENAILIDYQDYH